MVNFEKMSSKELLERRLTLHNELTQTLTLAIDLERSGDNFFRVTSFPLSFPFQGYELPAEIVDKVQIVNSENHGEMAVVIAIFTLQPTSLTPLLISLFQNSNLSKQKDLISLKSSAESLALTRSYIFYAPPLVFSPWVVVGSHVGQITYTISFKPQGDTQIQAQVRYFENKNLPRVERDILSGTSITTSDSVANVEMRFKGIPTGSAVDVSIVP